MSNTNNEWSAKHPEEVVVLSATFSGLGVGETLTSAVWSCAGYPELVFEGPADFSASPTTKQRVSGGNPGASYTIKIKVTTSMSQTLVGLKRLTMVQSTL